MENAQSEESFKLKARRKRVKTGCLNCRRKHKKCDEQKPACKLCAKRMEVCLWPESDLYSKIPAFQEQQPLSSGFESSSVASSNGTLLSPGLSSSLLSHDSTNLSTVSVPTPNTPVIERTQRVGIELKGEQFEANVSITHKSTNLNFEKEGSSIVTQPDLIPVSLPQTDHVLDPISPFSSHSLMTPYLNFTSLNRTFRDFMFTASSTQETSSPNNVIYRNILESPPPSFMSQAQSYSNLQELLNDQSLTNGAQNNVTETNICLNEKERLKLFKIFLYEVAPWLDMFDLTKQFGTAIPQLTVENKVLLNSIYALALRQQEQLREETPSQKTIAFYQESLRNLIPTVNQTLDISIIVSCVLLCVFDMMSSPPTNWRHHLEGCAALLRGRSINGFSSSKLEKAIFWCYSRMDVNAAIASEKPTMIPSEKWIPSNKSIFDLRELFTADNSEDLYANYMVFICSRVINLIALPQKDYAGQWQYIWDEVSDWYLNRPPRMRELKELEDKPFPGILFVNGPAISANQMFHMAVIILIQNRPRMHKIKCKPHMKSRIWHAKEICGISLHNEHHGCWNNAVQPLNIAGRLLSSDDEHRIILELLEKIELTTGWQMKFVSQELRNFWCT